MFVLFLQNGDTIIIRIRNSRSRTGDTVDRRVHRGSFRPVHVGHGGRRLHPVFRHKKLWFPCQFFSLDATSITLLAVATKLPTDLGTGSKSYTDPYLLTKFNGIVFLSTAMANFMSSLGSNADTDIRSNVVGLAILVITIAVDMLLQLVIFYHHSYSISLFFFVYTLFMLLLLATTVSLAVTVPAMKTRLESMYQEKHRAALREEEGLPRMERLKIDKMMKYWVMAETGSPQFVMARSVVCTTSALLCLLSVVTLVTASVIVLTRDGNFGDTYPSFTKSILYIQTTGVAVGSIAPICRWFFVVSFKCTRKINITNIPSGKDLMRAISSTRILTRSLNVESYWTQTLVDLRDSLSISQIWDSKLMRNVKIAKRFAITCCIGLQIVTVLLSKMFIVISTSIMTPFFVCYTRIKNFIKEQKKEDDEQTDLNDLREYVLLLDGEVELPKGVVRDICRRAKDKIEMGRKKQPRHLIKLLEKFTDFRGVETVSTLDSPENEIPNCWTLPVVTLTSIAIALPSVGDYEKMQLLSSVRQGLPLARLVDDIQNAELVNVRKAAEKLTEIDLKGITHTSSRSPEKVLEELSRKAGAVVRGFKNRVQDSSSGNAASNWPANVVAANSMLRITQAILRLHEQMKGDVGTRLFEQISGMIADVLAASLTNVPLVITTMCHGNAIEKREKNVRKAFLLLGKTEQIVRLVQEKTLSQCYDEAASVQVKFWRPLFQQRHR